MIPCGKARWLIAAALCGGLVAAEPAPEKSDPPEGGIATAKRDYEAIKAAGAPADQQQLALPKDAVPTLRLKSDLPPPVILPPQQRSESDRDKQKPDAARSENWLLEAMAEKKPASERSELDRSGREALRDEKLERGPATDAHGDAAGKNPQLRESARRTETPNPLAGYMASWLTPRDYELLKSKSASTLDGAGGASPLLPGDSRGTAVGPAGTAPAAPIDLAQVLAPLGRPAGDAPTQPKENPYLAGLETPLFAAPPATTAAPLPAPQALPAAPSTPAVQPPAAARVDNPTRELFKPREDDKYFKQLKRF